MVGLLCSTWVSVNAGTSHRDVLTPMGHPEYQSVAAGNQMTSRHETVCGLKFINFF